MAQPSPFPRARKPCDVLRHIAAAALAVAAVVAFACGSDGREEPPADDDAAVERARPRSGGADAAPTQPPVRTLDPDLSVAPMREYYIEGEGAERVLRFSTTVLNSGKGPLELLGSFDDAERVFVATQRTAMSDGGAAEEEVGRFVFHADHGHWHFEDFTTLEVWTVDDTGRLNEMMLTTGKGTFCAVDEVPELPDAGPPAYFTCGEGIQGISAGWSDTYGAEIPGQELALGALPDGTYALRSTVDPEGRLRETDDNNNSTVERVRITGTVIEATD